MSDLLTLFCPAPHKGLKWFIFMMFCGIIYVGCGFSRDKSTAVYQTYLAKYFKCPYTKTYRCSEMFRLNNYKSMNNECKKLGKT